MDDTQKEFDRSNAEFMESPTAWLHRRKNTRPMMRCDQCKVNCSACAIGAIHMNMDPLPFGASPIECERHNLNGHHHGMWNGASNEVVACGSARADQLVDYILTRRRFAEQTAIKSDDPHDPLDEPHVITAVHRDAKAEVLYGSSVGRGEQALADAEITSENILEARARQDRAVEAAVRPLADAKREAIERRANQRQVAGSHYGPGEGLQHWDIVAMFGLDYFQGNIMKYVFRHRKKHGIEDLEKAQHYLEKYIEELRAGRIT